MSTSRGDVGVWINALPVVDAAADRGYCALANPVI